MAYTRIPDSERCKARIFDGWHSGQCARPAKEQGYCTQHARERTRDVVGTVYRAVMVRDHSAPGAPMALKVDELPFVHETTTTITWLGPEGCANHTTEKQSWATDRTRDAAVARLKRTLLADIDDARVALTRAEAQLEALKAAEAQVAR